MAFGILNQSQNITMENLTSIINVTDPGEFFQNVNNVVFNGILFFILLLLLWVILFLIMRNVETLSDKHLVNAMYGGASCTIIGIFLRAASLLSDSQFYFFPLITIIIAVLVYSTSKS